MVPGATVHLYGKGPPRPGRKMGHVTQVGAVPPKTAFSAIKTRICQVKPEQLLLRRWTFAPLPDYIRALKVKGHAFCQPFALSELQSDQLKEDAACRFSFAITMSTKPSRC